ncbi:uncharacterized protein CEXT_692641 [Caerostris extrusa]|uniref:Uncharacterized protein n=1 Tax=Caerostris extrusa TaxID=172846 RepID=A0AAV4V7C4_CAEEX|nr:uncharacterized protein CEXT_692641 [Caerostris extrusa]
MKSEFWCCEYSEHMTPKPPRYDTFIAEKRHNERVIFPVYFERVTNKPVEYECYYPVYLQKKTVTSCYTVTRAPEICSETWLNEWRGLVQNCTLDRLKKMGHQSWHPHEQTCSSKFKVKYSTILGTGLNVIILYFSDRIVVKSFFSSFEIISFRLEISLSVCLRIIGDTTCRDESTSALQWVFQREMIITGGTAEHSYFHMNISKGLKRCVKRTDDRGMQVCFPGLGSVLQDLLHYGTTNRTLKMPRNRNTTCVARLFKHCELSELQTIERWVSSIYGTCIKFAPGYQKGGCVEDVIANHYCDKSDIRGFLEQIQYCWKQSYHSKWFSKQPMLEKVNAMNQCVTNCPINCIFSKWEVFKEVFRFIVQSLSRGKRDVCGSLLVSRTWKTADKI